MAKKRDHQNNHNVRNQKYVPDVTAERQKKYQIQEAEKRSIRNAHSAGGKGGINPLLKTSFGSIFIFP